MKKLQILKAARVAHIAVWTVIALLVIVSTCKVWWANGCGVSSLIAAILFFGVSCAGICLFGHLQFNEEIEDTEAVLKATQKPQRPAAPAQQPRQRKQVF